MPFSLLVCVCVPGGGGGGGVVFVSAVHLSVSFFVCVAAVFVLLLLLVLLVDERAGDPACLRYRSGEINYVHEHMYKCMFVFATSYAFQ